MASGLGYRPNAIARSLKARQSHTVGAITNDSDGVFTTAMVRGLAEVASQRGFGVFVCNSYDKVAKERQHLELLLEKQVDGIILIGYKVAERGAPALDTGRTALVYLYEYTSTVAAPCIVPDDEGGARLATNHVIGLGRRRMGFINGPPSYEATRLRLTGFRNALGDNGVTNSTSRTCRKMSAPSTRVLISASSASAGTSSSRWWLHGAAIPATNYQTGLSSSMNSFAPFATAHRCRRLTTSAVAVHLSGEAWACQTSCSATPTPVVRGSRRRAGW